MENKKYVGLRNAFELKKGDHICVCCEGTGIGEHRYVIYGWAEIDNEWQPICPECEGKGKFDWIDNVLKNGHK